MPLTNAEKQARHRTRKAEKMARMERGMASLAIAYVEAVEAANKNFADGGITYGELKAVVNTAAFMRDAGLEPDKGL